jgi:5S rRNA maturation endonuclease (ribonuclease M5)
MTRADQLALLEKVLARLIASNRRDPVLVEGKRDVAALRILGLEGEILVLNRGKSIVERCEGIARMHDHVILLTDWDWKGEELHEKIKRGLQSTGVKADDSFWQALKRFCGGGTRTVEDLPGFITELREAVSSATY